MRYFRTPINRQLYRQISAFICVHLRLISVSLSDRIRKIKFELFHIQETIESAPLLKIIQATDGLIDAIVYKLYGLTEDEIKIVEESISGGKDAKETGIAG